jgi:Mg-chelatase subunit ChlD
MRAEAGYLILLGLLLITGTVSASVADSSSKITPGKDWPVANNMDSSIITVVAKNLSFAPPLIGNAQVTFAVNDGNYGFFTSTTATTDINGIATTTFMTRTKSGTAVITATIVSSDMYGSHTQVVTLNQNIDHDLPQSAVFDTPAKLPVGNISILNVTVLDGHGNRVDSRGPNPVEHHTFNLYMPGAQGRGLWDGSNYVDTKQVETDADGNASIKFRMAYPAQMNQIYMDVLGNMVSPPEKWIEGTALSEPVYINHLHPSPDDINADGIAQFNLYFYAYDRYMNPVNDTRLHIEADDGMNIDRNTSILGSVFTPFGPKDTASVYNITLTSSNTSALCLATGKIGYCSQNLSFHNTEPVDLVITANPQGGMPSLDVNPASRGTITARVVDVKGNPVIGETVTFTMQPRTYMWPGGLYNETQAPTLNPLSTTTGGANYAATSTFTPGAFATSLTPDSWNATATGEATVAVTWTNKAGTITKTQYVTLVWKNYPYLSITVPTDACKNAVVGDKIDIKLSLFGDGAALLPKPIDVVLTTDVSGSMAGQKIIDARNAAKIFAASMSTRDRVGLESFGHAAAGSPWTAKAKDDISLTSITFGPGGTIVNPINTTIDTYAADSNTPTRPAIYNATYMIKRDPRAGAVKAIVLMTDGAWNKAGDPRGVMDKDCDGGTDTRMSFNNPDVLSKDASVVTYAKDNGIKIYTVGLGVTACTATELQKYATETGGKYYSAPSSSQLAGIYKQIAGDLQETAGGNTKVTLDYGTVNINGALGNILDYMSYEKKISMPSMPGDSTYVMKTNTTPAGATNLQYQYSRDDTANWTAKQMKFDVGEMKLNETWSTSFTVNLTKAGQIDMFGPTSPSQVCFTDASTGTTTCQKFPPWSCPVQQSKMNVGFGAMNLSIENMTVDAEEGNPNLLIIGWNLTYDGDKGVQQKIQYYTAGTAPKPVIPGGLRFETAKCNQLLQFTQVDTTTWAPGTYTFTIDASSEDAKNPPQITVNWIKQAPTGQKFIKLE